MIAQSRKRAVQCIFQLNLTWPSRGAGIAWINPAHKTTAFPLYDSMVGKLYSKKPFVSSVSWISAVATGPDGGIDVFFDWVDEDGNVIDTANHSGQGGIYPLGQIGYTSVNLTGVRRELNTLPAGLKQTIEIHEPTDGGSFAADIGFKTATAWLTLYGNNLPT